MDVERLGKFIIEIWEIDQPIPHPFFKNTFLGFFLSKEESQTEANNFILLLQKTPHFFLIKNSKCFEILFSLYCYFGEENFKTQDCFKKILSRDFSISSYQSFLTQFLRRQETRNSLRLFSQTWVTIREREIQWLQQ